MPNKIEETRLEQLRNLKGILISFFSAQVLLGVRYTFYMFSVNNELNSQPIGYLVVFTTIVMMLIMVFFIVKQGLLHGRIMADSHLREALVDDEVDKLNLKKSWQAGFIAAAVTPLLFAMISSIVPFNDLLVVAFTTMLIGSSAFLLSYYVRNAANV